MKKYNILYIGRNIEILNTVVRLLNANKDWLGIGALDDVMAKSLFREYTIQVVLLGAGISEESELNLLQFSLARRFIFLVWQP